MSIDSIWYKFKAGMFLFHFIGLAFCDGLSYACANINMVNVSKVGWNISINIVKGEKLE